MDLYIGTMRVLIIGASGLLGRALVKAFGVAGHEVFAVGVGAVRYLQWVLVRSHP